MSKYYKAEDVQELIIACEWRMTLAKERGGTGFVEYDKQVLDVGELRKRLSNLPTIEVSEEDELKFYYVDSIDDYWVGRRLDNFYYAEWVDKLGFVWTHSRYLPWGEHVVAEDTLWKEHTYPSEPREIPFTEWIVGFMKKYSVVPNVGDAISKHDLWRIVEDNAYWVTYNETSKEKGITLTGINQALNECPPVVPKPKEGEWIYKGNSIEPIWNCSECGKQIICSQSELPNYCEDCGAKMRGGKDD